MKGEYIPYLLGLSILAAFIVLSISMMDISFSLTSSNIYYSISMGLNMMMSSSTLYRSDIVYRIDVFVLNKVFTVSTKAI